MDILANEKCVVCLDTDPALNDEEIGKMLKLVPGWSVKEEEGIKKIWRSYKFENFVKAQNFSLKVGLLAEEEGHHPELITEWGKVTVVWWTHKISGLHTNDFIMAAKTDKLYP
jgi:4a-hydroxytetrahydrobiopterin dehydratase